MGLDAIDKVPLVVIGLFGLGATFVVMIYYGLGCYLRGRREATLQQPPLPQEPEGEECYLFISILLFWMCLYEK
jgi:hypothetical protein